MTTRMLINATVANELRIAIVEDGELTELDIETTDQNQIRGNIYKGVIHNVEGSLAACFVDIGGHKQGFLPFDEISSDHYARKPAQGEALRITEAVRRGQEIVVQVAKDAVGEKGATLTTYLSIPGRFTVLMPGSDASGVSRKIEDDAQRKKIRAMAAKIERPEDCGFIVRTAGFGQSRIAIQKDLNNVIEIYEKVKRSAAIAHAPSLLYAEPDLIARTLRDFFNEDIDEVWIDTREEHEAARAYFEDLMPKCVERIRWYQNPIPIFAYYHVEEQIETTFHRTVALPSGGSIVIDETEALVAIDVNSGKMTSERDHEDTVYKTNLEAAEEIARQLKLRDLGGIIVIDFIDMELRKNERLVEKALLDASKDDKARYKISRINAQGLCVLTRQRIRQGMRRAFQRRCQTCAGTGWIRTSESHSLSLLRRVETRLAQGGVGEVRVATHRETAEYLLNHKRAEIMALERQYQCRVVVSAKSEMDRDADEVLFLSKGEMLAEITDRLPPREERRQDRGSRRKRGKKKRAQIAAQSNGNVHPEGGEGERQEREGSRKRRRRSGRDRGEGAPSYGDAPRAPLGAEGQVPDASSPREARVREQDGRQEGPGGTTFTGRPPPDVLERLRRERRERMNARTRPQGVSSEAMEVVSSSPAGGPPSSAQPAAMGEGGGAPGSPERTAEAAIRPKGPEAAGNADRDRGVDAPPDVGATVDEGEGSRKKGLLERLGVLRRLGPPVPPADNDA